MPIRIHVSQLSEEARLAKLGVKRRAKPRELERQHQVALIKWVRAIKDAYPVLKLLYAVPNGGDRNINVARKLKAEGVLAGVADLCLCDLQQKMAQCATYASSSHKIMPHVKC
jgi:hypothetical protein